MLIATIVPALSGCTETIDTTYATLEEAQSKGAIASGWIPAWLPTNATNIREVHNIDTNYFMLGFSLAKDTKVQLPIDCTNVGPRTPSKPPFQRDWWPADVPANALATHRHSFFKCGRYFVAYSNTQAEAFVWSIQ